MTPSSFAIAFRASASANDEFGVRFHEENLRAAERDIRVEGKALARRELQMRVATGQLRDRDLGL
jgi:hypothetical protein